MLYTLYRRVRSGKYFWLVDVDQCKQLVQQKNCFEGVNIRIEEADLVKTPKDEAELKASRTQRRVFELLSKAAASNQSDPISEGTAGKRYAVGTGQFETLKCGLVLKSIGYQSVPIEGLPFDDLKGIVPNVRGRVLGDPAGESSYEKGLYVAGWLKRGPTGIIATNLYCAEETVASIIEDLKHGATADSRKCGHRVLLEALNRKNIRYVRFSGWEKIDSKEKYLRSLKNKPREKITSWEEQLEVAFGEN